MAASLGRDPLILTINQRLARHLLFKYSKLQKSSGKQAWETPQIIEFNSWFKLKWLQLNTDHFLLSEIQSIKIWESIIINFSGNGKSTNRKKVINQWSLLNLREAAKKSSEAYKLITQHRISIPSDPLLLSTENNLFLKWMEQYKKILIKNKAIDSVVLIDLVREGMKNKNIYIPDFIQLCGFEEITPQLQIWLDFLKSQQKKIVLKNNPNKNNSRLNKDILKNKNIEIYSFKDLKDECRNCANWVRSTYSKDQTIGIIVPELEKYRRSLYKELFSNLIPESIFPGKTIETPFDISLGTPLSDEGMIQIALELLSIKKEFPINKVLHIVNSPYINSGKHNNDERNELEIKLQKEGFLNVNIERIENFYGPESSSEIKKLLQVTIKFIKITDTKLPSAWAKCFSKILKDLGWMLDPSKTLSSREIQCLVVWNECLDALASLDMFTEKVSRHSILKELKEITHKKLFQIKTKEQPIQVLGVLESIGITFDHIWIMGCHSDCIPAKPNPNPFIPINIQKQLQLPHSNSKRELQFSEKTLNRLANSSQNIIFSYPEWEQNNKKQITSLLNIFSKTKKKFSYTKSYRVRDRIKPLNQIEIWEDKSKVPPSPSEFENLTMNGLKNGYKVLQNQAACSFQSFAANRLNANDYKVSAIDYDSRDRGILIHKVLQLFWEKHKTQSVLKNLKTSNMLKGELEKKVKEAIRGVNIQVIKQSHFMTMEQNRTVDLLLDWMDQEILRPTFEVKHIEKKELIVIGNLRLNLRIDRIDVTSEGEHILIDYKTGSTNTNTWFMERIQDPQLPLYSVKSSPTAIAFAHISKGSLKWKSIWNPIIHNPFPEKSKVKIPLNIEKEIGWPNWSSLLKFWEIKLNILADNFMDGQIVINPINKDNTCQNCSYAMLCRIGENATDVNSWENTDA
jgi:ATP-dependent helicase/nuclease subunit B